MRTTIDLDDDTAAAVRQLREAESSGLSQAVNTLIRRGLVGGQHVPLFTPQSVRLGLTIDISNIADALDLLEGPQAR